MTTTVDIKEREVRDQKHATEDRHPADTGAEFGLGDDEGQEETPDGVGGLDGAGERVRTVDHQLGKLLSPVRTVSHAVAPDRIDDVKGPFPGRLHGRRLAPRSTEPTRQTGTRPEPGRQRVTGVAS